MKRKLKMSKSRSKQNYLGHSPEVRRLKGIFQNNGADRFNETHLARYSEVLLIKSGPVTAEKNERATC